MSFVQNFPFFSIILCLLCAVTTFVAGDKWGRRLTIGLLSVSIVLQSCVLWFCASNNTSYSYMMGHFPAPWGNEIAAGVIEPLMALLFSVVMLLSVLGGMDRILKDIPDKRRHLYWSMVDLTLVSLLALSYTNDIFTGYVFIEICTIASCALLSAKSTGRALIASARYMVFALVGSGLFLIGVIYTYSITGHLLFPQLHDTIAALWTEGTYQFSMTVAIGLMTAGLAIKSGLFPFHFWMPDTYGRATPASSGILSGVVSKAYILLLIKIIYRAVGIEVFAESGIQSVLVLFGIAGLYFLLDYTYLGAAQIAVYAGGITVMYVFAIQLVNKRALQGKTEHFKGSRLMGGLLISLLGLATVVGVILKHKFIDMAASLADKEVTMQEIGTALVGSEKYQYVLPFELISVFLLACIIGGIMIARKEDQK